MVEILDKLVEEVELVSTDIKRLNFEIDGFREDTERLVEKQPYMIRQIQQAEKKIYRLADALNKKMFTKAKLDKELEVLRVEYQAELKAERDAKEAEKQSKAKALAPKVAPKVAPKKTISKKPVVKKSKVGEQPKIGATDTYVRKTD